ncbi:hypothetical protein D3C81_08620 [compost metagenome]
MIKLSIKKEVVVLTVFFVLLFVLKEPVVRKIETIERTVQTKVAIHKALRNYALNSQTGVNNYATLKTKLEDVNVDINSVSVSTGDISYIGEDIANIQFTGGEEVKVEYSSGKTKFMAISN